jgi:hypothetical protein
MGKTGTPGVAIGNVEESGLVSLNDDRDGPAVVENGRQQRWRGGVVITEIVMDELESPLEDAGFGVERNYRVGPLVIAWSRAAIVVGACSSGWHEDEIALSIERHHRPCVGGSGDPGAGRDRR